MLDAIKPNKNCQFCKGKGQVPGKKEGTTIKCSCMVRQEAIRYLTDIYANAKYIKGLNAQVLEGKNLFIDRDPQRTFKAAVKSFLLNTALKYDHTTVSAHDVLYYYLGDQGSFNFKRIQTIDFLVIYLVADPANKIYGDLLVSVLEKRSFIDLPTWIFTDKGVDSKFFQDKYSIKLSNYILKNFTPLRGISKTVGF